MKLITDILAARIVATPENIATWEKLFARFPTYRDQQRESEHPRILNEIYKLIKLLDNVSYFPYHFMLFNSLTLLFPRDIMYTCHAPTMYM